MRLLKLLKNRPPNFAGETIGIEFDAIANEQILAGNAVEVDQQGEVIATKETLLQASGAEGDSSSGDDDGAGDGDDWKFDPRTDPFVTDGISKQASQALHAAKLHTVEAVRKFIAETPEGESAVDRVNAIEGVTDAQAEKIVKMYGMVTEHSDE